MNTWRTRIITLLEKIFKTDVRYFIHGGWWLTLSEIINSGSTFLLSLAFGNLVDPTVYGDLKYIGSILSILGLATLANLNVATTLAVAQGKSGSARSALRIRLAGSMIGLAAGVVYGLYLIATQRHMIGLGLIIASVFIPLTAFDSYSAILNGLRSYALINRYQVWGKIVLVGTTLTAIFFLPSLPVLSLTYYGLPLLVLVYAWFATTHRFPPNNEVEKNTAAFGVHLSIVKGLTTVIGTASSLLLYHISGSTALALFAFIIAPIEQIRMLIVSNSRLLLPKISTMKTDHPRRLFLRKFFPFGVLFTLGALLYTFIAPYLYAWLLPRYTAAVPYSQWFVWSIPFTAFIVILKNMILVQAQTSIKKQYQSELTESALSLIVTIPAVMLGGLAGLIAALLINKIIMSVVTFYLAFSRPASTDPVSSEA